MKQLLITSMLVFAAACASAQGATLKELKAEEKMLKAQAKQYKEAEQIEKVKANIIKLREYIIAKEKSK